LQESRTCRRGKSFVRCAGVRDDLCYERTPWIMERLKGACFRRNFPKGRAVDVTIESLKKERTYSEELGIDLEGAGDGEVFKWFLASVLFGARIPETIAKRTYRAFERHDLLTPERILQAGWDFLVNPVMREGGYVRYDGRGDETAPFLWGRTGDREHIPEGVETLLDKGRP
jgi:hypothetical protein